MPYIFLNTVADITNFYVPTPIIISGDYLTGQNNIKTKCDKIISHDVGCSAYLLSVSLVELLDVLEREGFKTVKVNRNGNHNLWILHKDSNSDKLRPINSIKKRTVQISKKNYMFEENSSNSSFEKSDRYNLSQFYKPCMKSEKSQTPTHLSLFGGGDFTNVFSVHCQCDDEQSRMMNQEVIAYGNKNTTDEKPEKLQKDFQNQMNLNDIVNSVDIGCQFNASGMGLKTYKCCDLKEIDQAIYDSNTNKNKNSNITISDRNNPETTVSKDKHEMVEEKNCDTFFNVLSETTLTTDNNKDSNSNNSIFDKAGSFSNIGLKDVGNSTENICDQTHDILVKLKKRFKNEHEYFSNVRIKKSKKKEKYPKKPIDKSKKLNTNSGTLLVNFKDDFEKCGKNVYVQNDLNDKNNISLKDTINFGNKIDITDKIANLTIAQSSESLNFYDALDTISVISIQDSFKSIINGKYHFKDIKRIGNKVKTKNIDKDKLFRNINQTNNINSLKKFKNVDKSKRFHVTYNRCNIDSLEKVTYTDKFSCNKYSVKEVDKVERMGHLNDSLENVTFADCFDDLAKLDCSKSHLHLDFSVKSGKIDIKSNPAVDYLTPDNQRDIFKEKMQMTSSKQQCDFKNRFHQRAERIQINQKQLKFVSSFRQRNIPGLIKEPIRNSNDGRELKMNQFNNSIPTFVNKKKVPAVSPVNHPKFQPCRIRRFGDFRL